MRCASMQKCIFKCLRCMLVHANAKEHGISKFMESKRQPLRHVHFDKNRKELRRKKKVNIVLDPLWRFSFRRLSLLPGERSHACVMYKLLLIPFAKSKRKKYEKWNVRQQFDLLFCRLPCWAQAFARRMNGWTNGTKKIINKSLNKYHEHISMWFHCFNLLNMFTRFSLIVFVLDLLFIVCAMQTGGNCVMCVRCAVRKKLQIKKRHRRNLFTYTSENKTEKKMRTTIKGAKGFVLRWKVVARHNIISIYDVDLVWTFFLSVWRIRRWQMISYKL